MKRVAVIGAGVAGVNVAYQLAKQGFAVSVFEKNDRPARECSYANGGQVSVCNSSTWTNWHTIWKASKWLLKKDAPLLFSPKPELEKLLWLAGFLKATALGKYQENTVKTIIMGLESRAAMIETAADQALDFSQSACGLLHVYQNLDSFKRAESERDLFESNGVEWISKTPDEIAEIDVAVGAMDGLVGGIWTPSDFTGDIHQYCVDLSNKIEMQYMVDFHYNAPVARVFPLTNGKAGVQLYELLSETLEFDSVVICNGHLLQSAARSLGEFLNVYPVKGYSITVPIEEETFYAPHVSLLDDDKKIVSSYFPADEWDKNSKPRLRVAGTAELAGHDDSIRHERVEPLVRWVRENFPDLDSRFYEPWACLRPMSSDMMPIVRQSKYKTIWYNGGYGHLGWTLSAGQSKRLAREIALSLR